MGLGGMLIDTGERQWRKNEYLEVEILGRSGVSAMRLPAVVVHQNEQSVGVMFDTVTSEQRRTLRAWLFGHTAGDAALAETVYAVA